MICKKCGQNMGQTTENDRALGNLFIKQCPGCGFVNQRVYPGYSQKLREK